MKPFDEMPYIEGEGLILREMVIADAWRIGAATSWLLWTNSCSSADGSTAA